MMDRVQPQPKQMWSEEDEKFFKTALWHISYSISNGESTDIQCDTTNWLKSLKERVQPQPQQEWSEEDEQLYNDLSDTYFYNDEDYPEETYKRMLKRVLDWMTKRVKFIRPQNTWKPSEEHLVALRIAIGDEQGSDCCNILRSLLKDLKSL